MSHLFPKQSKVTDDGDDESDLLCEFTEEDDDIDSCKILEKTGERLALPVVRRRGGGVSRVKITEIFSFPLHALFLIHPAKTCQFRLNQRPDLTFYTLPVLFTFIGGHPQQFYV